MLGGILGGGIDDGSVGDRRACCSRAGCSESADWAIVWRNPKIHTGDRRKTWLACSEHRSFLEEFLAARDFPMSVIPAASLPENSVAPAPKEHDA